MVARRSRPARAAALLIGALGALTIASCGSEEEREVPAGAVAIVEDVEGGTVTDEDYDDAFDQSAGRIGLDQPPAQGTAEFDQVNQEAMQALLLERWAQGEATERGIEVTEADVQDELDGIRDSFATEKEFRRVVREARFCSDEEVEADVPPIECEDVVEQGRLLALQRRLQTAFEDETDATGEDATAALTEIQQDFVEKWTERTTCDAEVAIELCRGFEPPEPDTTSTQSTDPAPGE